MYIALHCPHCGEDHPLRSMSRREIIILLTMAAMGRIHEVATNDFTDREWGYILLAEIVIRNRS